MNSLLSYFPERDCYILGRVVALLLLFVLLLSLICSDFGKDNFDLWFEIVCNLRLCLKRNFLQFLACFLCDFIWFLSLFKPYSDFLQNEKANLEYNKFIRFYKRKLLFIIFNSFNCFLLLVYFVILIHSFQFILSWLLF